MTKVVVSSLAFDDAASILRYLNQEAGGAIARRYDAEIRRVLSRLERFPRSGAPRPALGAAVRIAVVSPYVVIHEYAEAEDTVLVLRILHGSRDITRRLLRRAAAET